jgi:hypothetical protein
MYSSLAETPIDLVRQDVARFRSGVFLRASLSMWRTRRNHWVHRMMSQRLTGTAAFTPTRA